MFIESRGEAPYQVSSGKVKTLPESQDHFATAETFEAAFALILQSTDGGKAKDRTDYIMDSSGAIIFTVENPDDVVLLRQVCELGLLQRDNDGRRLIQFR